MEETLFLKCIIDENRRAIVRQLEDGEMAVGDIAERLEMEQSLCSHHLAKLRNCGLVEAEQRGKSVFYRISDPRILRLMEQLRDVSGCVGECGCD
jgi:DNA-binding transcriptional ArsR family regulator